MAIEFPDLPFEKSALEPAISARTLDYHHGKHHKNYVTKLNELIKDTPLDKLELEAIILESAGSIEAVFNNAAQAWNHNFYWNCLTPDALEVSDEFNKALSRKFGSFEKFKTEFENSARKLFGSGWTWLVCDNQGTISILNTKDADNPIVHEMIPLLACDVWEHAYYLDYQNERGKYLQNFWEIINWKFVEENYNKSKEKIMKRAPEEQSQHLH